MRSRSSRRASALDKPTPGYHDFVTALDVFLTADHGGLPAQSEIQIGYAEANAQASEPAPLPDAAARCRRREARRRSRAARAEERRPAARAQQAAERHAEADRGRLRVPGLRELVVHRHLRRATRRRLRRLAPRRRHLRPARRAAPRGRATGRCSRWAGTRSAAGASGCATTRGTSSTTRISRRTRRSRSTARIVNAGDVLGFVGNTGDAAGNAVPPPLRGASRSACSGSATTAPSTRRATSGLGAPRRTCASTPAPAGRRRRTSANAPKAGAILLQTSRHLERERSRPGVARARAGVEGDRG